MYEAKSPWCQSASGVCTHRWSLTAGVHDAWAACLTQCKPGSKAEEYLKYLPVKQPLDLRKKYMGASAEALDLLSGMLRFDPSCRITVDQALEHPYLASCRRREREASSHCSFVIRANGSVCLLATEPSDSFLSSKES